MKEEKVYSVFSLYVYYPVGLRCKIKRLTFIQPQRHVYLLYAQSPLDLVFYCALLKSNICFECKIYMYFSYLSIYIPIIPKPESINKT